MSDALVFVLQSSLAKISGVASIAELSVGFVAGLHVVSAQ